MTIKTITFNDEAASLKDAFNEFMEAKRAQIAELNGTLAIDMQILERIIGDRYVLRDVAMDKTLRWLMLSGDDAKDLKTIRSLAMRKGRGDSSSTCLLQSAMIQAEREAVFEVLDFAERFVMWHEREAAQG